MWAYVALDPVMVEAPPDTTTTPPPPTWTAWVDLAARWMHCTKRKQFVSGKVSVNLNHCLQVLCRWLFWFQYSIVLHVYKHTEVDSFLVVLNMFISMTVSERADCNLDKFASCSAHEMPPGHLAPSIDVLIGTFNCQQSCFPQTSEAPYRFLAEFQPPEIA